MEITANNILIIGAALLMLSVYAGKAGSRYGLPSLLLFLIVGMVAGSDGFGLQFDSPETAQFIGMISLSVILFSGGVDTRFSEIRPVLGPGLVLATVGVLLTTALTGAFIYYVFHWLAPDYAFGWAESLLLAAIMSSTDSASVFSILNSSGTKLKQNLKPTLELESGSNDPMAYLLVIILIGAIEETGASVPFSRLLADSGLMLLKQLALGTLCGIAAGFVTVRLINRFRSDNEFLYPVMMIACILFTFTLTEMAGGNSYLAVYIAGLVVGNRRIAVKRTITKFFGGFTWLVQITMFLSLGLLVNPGELVDVIVPGIALGLFMILAARPAAVFLSLLPFRQFTTKARIYLSWVGLRGAVPIIFATYAVISPDVTHAGFMFNVVFFITILSLLIQGTTVRSMARWLGLSEESDRQAFGEMELPEDTGASLSEICVTGTMLAEGNTLKEIDMLGKGLVIMIKRQDGSYVVPRGDTRLYIGDCLLVIEETAGCRQDQ